MNKDKINIYRSGIAGESDQNKPRMRTSGTIDQICVTGNHKQTPGEIRKWLVLSQEKAMKEGWKNFRIETLNIDGDEFNLPNSYICLVGDRIETDNEVKQRVEHLIASTLR